MFDYEKHSAFVICFMISAAPFFSWKLLLGALRRKRKTKSLAIFEFFNAD